MSLIEILLKYDLLSDLLLSRISVESFLYRTHCCYEFRPVCNSVSLFIRFEHLSILSGFHTVTVLSLNNGFNSFGTEASLLLVVISRREDTIGNTV